MNQIEKIEDALVVVTMSEGIAEYLNSEEIATIIQALQEKLERENPQEDCKYCNGKSYRDRKLIPLYQSHDFAEIVIDTDNALYISNEYTDLSINTAEILYCPMCGRKLNHVVPKHIGEATNMVEGE